MKLILERFCDSEKGTFGRLSYAGHDLAYTVERPWKDNKPFESCVPVGTYKLVPFIRENGDHVFALINRHLKVYKTRADMMANGGKGRYAILIHVANYVDNVVGCIGPGEQWSYDCSKMRLMVTNSRAATKMILALIRNEGIQEIEIKWRHGK